MAGAPRRAELVVEHEQARLPAPALPRRRGPSLAWLPGPRGALALVMLATVLGRLVWLREPDRALIFDEAYYVNAARVILGRPVPPGSHYAKELPRSDPNHEHPPLGKLAIATSMRLLGDGPLGWRLPSLLAGVAAVLLMHAVVAAAGGGAWLGVLAAGLLAFDNLALVQSRIATLDMPLVAALLLASWLALRRRPLLAGVACALAALIKLTAVFGVLALVLFFAGEAMAGRRRTAHPGRDAFRQIGLLLAGCVPVWLVGLWLADLGVGVHRAPWDHLAFMLRYGFSLTMQGGPQGQESYPWQWLLNEVQMTYLRTDEQVLANGVVIATRPIVHFRGAMNPVLVGAVPLGIGFAAWRAWRHGDTLALWAVTWFVGTHLAFYPLAIVQHRVSYLFYFLTTLPAAAVAVAKLLREASLPPAVVGVYLAMIGAGFVGYFPFRIGAMFAHHL